jgi:ABC-type cobalamin/Fe3+-siderophores transport system ATPase subunit
MTTISLNVPTPSGAVKLQASPSAPLFVVGRNGTGKSALVHSFAAQLGGKAIYLPGSRPSYFDQESLSITPSSRRLLSNNFRTWDLQPDTRWKSVSGTSRNEKAIHDLTAAETQFKVDAANEIARDGKESSAVVRLQAGMSPLDRVNALLKQGNLPITVTIDAAELKAVKNNNTYSIARTSDGERIALVLLAEVVAAPAGSVFLIDEPELHLHRAVVIPLISSIIHENSESTFIVSTHELDLVAICSSASIAIVRGCSWKAPNICEWEMDRVATASELPEDVRVDILGSRRKILFVEGTATSLDGPLYTLLFPNASVRSREGCREVVRVVTGLQETKNMHHAEVFAMVDGDGMSPEQITAFESKNVYPLPVHSVESLYYAEEVLEAVAQRQGETLGVDRNALLTEARSKAIGAIDSEERITHLASRLAERQLRESVLQWIPDRKDLITKSGADVSISVSSTYPEELARLRRLRDNKELAGIVSRYPVRESGLLDALAKGLRFSGRADYEKAVLRRLSVDDALCGTLRTKLGRLAPKLA